MGSARQVFQEFCGHNPSGSFWGAMFHAAYMALQSLLPCAEDSVTRSVLGFPRLWLTWQDQSHIIPLGPHVPGIPMASCSVRCL